MSAVSIALLTISDMATALVKGMVIEAVRLLEKTGGNSGVWRAE
jgi:cyclic pyranopterin phosphate synthase